MPSTEARILGAEARTLRTEAGTLNTEARIHGAEASTLRTEAGTLTTEARTPSQGECAGGGNEYGSPEHCAMTLQCTVW